MNAFITFCLLHRCVLLASELCLACSNAALTGYVTCGLSSQLHAVIHKQAQMRHEQLAAACT